MAHLNDFFRTLKRERSPNNWLTAPADFIVKPDAVAPVFPVPASVLRDRFKAAALRSKNVAVVEESAAAMHVVAITRWMRFQDDVWALFIPRDEESSTLVLYSASRVGYWDTGTNRRRVTNWIERLRLALEALEP